MEFVDDSAAFWRGLLPGSRSDTVTYTFHGLAGERDDGRATGTLSSSVGDDVGLSTGSVVIELKGGDGVKH